MLILAKDIAITLKLSIIALDACTTFNIYLIIYGKMNILHSNDYLRWVSNKTESSDAYVRCLKRQTILSTGCLKNF